MTLYFEKKVQFPPSAQLGNRIYSDILWHPIHPLLAIAAFDDKQGGLVSVYDHTKEETIDIDSNPKHDIQVTSIAWHPTIKYLAIGYETGEVLIWNHDENEIFEGAKSHHGPVTIVQWSHTDGSVLISTDTLGSLVVWTSNASGHIQTKAHHDFNDPVMQLIARPIQNKSDIKENVENLERSLGKMTSWRPKTAAKRSLTVKKPVRGRTRILKSSGRGHGGDGDDADVEIDDDDDEDNDPFKNYNVADDDTMDNFNTNRNSSHSNKSQRNINYNNDFVATEFNHENSKPTSSSSSDHSNEHCFFVGLLSGAIFYLKDSGSCEEVLTSGSPIKHLLFQESADVLIVMTEAYIMGQFKADSSGALNELSKVKLSGMGDIRISWVGPNTIAVLSKELSIRLWDLETGENSVLEADPALSYNSDEIFSSVDFQNNTGILSCSTNKGKIIMWRENLSKNNKSTTNNDEDDDAHNWEWYNSTTTSSLSTTKEIQWSQTVPGTMTVNGVRDVYILTEHQLVAIHKDKVSVIQTQQNEVRVSLTQIGIAKDSTATNESSDDEDNDGDDDETKIRSKDSIITFNIKTDIQIKNFVVNSNYLCIWSGQEVQIYEISLDLQDYYRLVGSFKDKCESLSLFEQSLFILETEHIQIRSFQGTLKQTLTFINSEGYPILLTNTGEYITVATANGYIKLWHVGQREAKLHSTSPNLVDNLADFGEIIIAKNNYDGSKVAFTVAQKTNLTPDSRFFIWDLPSETITTIAFPGQFITQLYWELENTTFLALELKVMSPEILASTNTSVHHLKSKLVYGAEEISNDTLVDNDDDDEDEGIVRDSIDEKKNDKKNSEASGNQKKIEDDDGDDGMNKYFVKNNEAPKVQNQFVTVFHTIDKGILIHSKIQRNVETLLLGLEVPHMIVLEPGAGGSPKESTEDEYDRFDRKNKQKENKNESSQIARIVKKIIQDFDELDEDDKNSISKAALTKSIYFDVIGDNDAALKALKPISTKSIWLKMAKRCVSTKRLDIATLCFAHIKDARGAMAIQAIQEEEPKQIDLHLARLALHLQMNVEAFELYKKAERYDCLIEIYKAMFEWDAAIAVCEKHLRIQLRTTYYEYAKYLEEEGLIEEAIEMYEKSDTFRTEVPRLLSEKNQVDKLEEYVIAKKDKDLYKWWAQYLESGNDLETALQYYELADDWLSLVRLLCFTGHVDRAISLVERVDDKASAYHLARAFEDAHEPTKAIHFYTKAGAYGSGIRICKEYGRDDDLWNLALYAEQIEQADSAKYFETKEEPDYDRAIRLYHLSGYGAKALDLAFTTQEFGALQSIVKDLLQNKDQRTDPELLKKCAEFFIANKEYEKALDTLTAAERYVEAMEMCVEYNVPISEDMAERLTAPKGGVIDEPTRLKLLLKMGECCMSQGNYHLAAKKFTQGGDKVQAMKSLLKSGDTERIIFYANVCRHREIYMMAAHYLQTLDLKANSQNIDVIIQFYTKAKAPESIIAFYESCAQSSAEEVDYVSSLKHLRSAETTTKNLLENNNTGELSSDTKSLQNRLLLVQAKISYVEKFLTVQRMLETKNNEVSELIQQLLEDANVEMSVRKGDIYALLVETFTSLGDFSKAVDVIDEMKSVLTHNPIKYFKGDTLQILQKGIGNQQIGLGKASGHQSTKSKKTPGGNNLPPYLNESGDDDSGRGQNIDYEVDEEIPDEEVEEEEEEIEDDDDDDAELLNNQVQVDEDGEQEEEIVQEDLNHEQQQQYLQQHYQNNESGNDEGEEEDHEEQLRMIAKFGVGLSKFN